MVEIERKFLMEGFPADLELLREVYIEQGYLGFDPELRVRKAVVRESGKEEYYLTLKSEGDLTRHEVETEIPAGFYQDVASYLGEQMLRKEYKAYRLGAWELEVSHVDAGKAWEFYYAEIEFPTEEEALAFVPPACLGREITYESDYKMKNFWKRTRG